MRPGAPLSFAVDPEQRRKRLGHDHRPDDVDFQLAAEIGERQFQRRPRDRDAGIVDEPGERFAVSAVRTFAAAATAASSVTSKISGTKLPPNSLGEAVGIGLFAHAAEHAKAMIEQQPWRWPSRCRWTFR